MEDALEYMHRETRIRASIAPNVIVQHLIFAACESV